VLEVIERGDSAIDAAAWRWEIRTWTVGVGKAITQQGRRAVSSGVAGLLVPAAVWIFKADVQRPFI